MVKHFTHKQSINLKDPVFLMLNIIDTMVKEYEKGGRIPSFFKLDMVKFLCFLIRKITLFMSIFHTVQYFISIMIYTFTLLFPI